MTAPHDPLPPVDPRLQALAERMAALVEEGQTLRNDLLSRRSDALSAADLLTGVKPGRCLTVAFASLDDAQRRAVRDVVEGVRIASAIEHARREWHRMTGTPIRPVPNPWD